jgi:prepilin-type processing-associated H-X9-DG protein
MTRQQRLSAPRRLARRPRGLTHIDIIVLICCLGLGILVGCFTRTTSRGPANRVKCASNLRQIGQAMMLYANDHKGAYPRVIFVAGADPKPVWGTAAPDPNDVTATMFLLLRTQDLTADAFVCPSTDLEKDNFGGGPNTAINRMNFSDVRKNLSYSIHNPYTKDGVVPADDKTYWTTSMSAPFPLAADINPGTAGERDNVHKPTVTSSAREMQFANSNNHDKDGQNILYNDGHVAWESNPFVGIDRDNIYTTGDQRVIASPATVTDGILLPTDD